MSDAGYGPIFSSLWNGSLVGKAHEQLVFIFLRCNCDRDGNANFHPQTISSLTGIPLADVETAIHNLEAHDPRSKSPEESGARLVRLDAHRDWGWHIVNHGKYLDLLKRIHNRERQSRFKERVKAGNAGVTLANAGVTLTNVDTSHKTLAIESKHSSPDGDLRVAGFVQVWDLYPHYGRRSSRAKSLTRWRALKPFPLLPDVLHGLRSCMESDDWTREGGRFVPAMEVWIAKRGWDSSNGADHNGTEQSDPLARARAILAEKEASLEKPIR